MRDDWKETTLGEVATIVNGSTPSTKKPEYWGGDIPWITTTELTACDDGFIDSSIRNITPRAIDSGGARIVRSGATLLGTTATIGTAALAVVDTSFNQQISGLLPKSGRVLDEFLFLWARGNRTHLNDLSAGTSFKRISTVNLKNLSFMLPPLAEQKRMVDVVSSVDTYIDALQQQADSARTARNAVLHELLSAGGDDWTETTLGDIAEVVGGGTPSTTKEEFWDGDVIWLTPTEVTAIDGKVISDSKRKITKAGLQSSGARVLPKGTVILTSRASVGFVALAGTELTTNQGFQSLIPSERVDGVFLMFWIQINRAEFESRSAGSTFKEISKSNVKSIAIKLPPLVEQKRIVDVVSSIDDVIQSTEPALADAKNLRSGLLSDLLSGEHEIPASYDKFVGAA